MTQHQVITAERLREILRYDPDTGIFTWLKPTVNSRRKAGERAGCLLADGYRAIGIDRKLVKEHRLAFLYVTGKWPTNHVDHINGIRDQNKWSNLREATSSENSRNARRFRNNKSGYKGVCFHVGKWQASIKAEGKVQYLGRFDTPEAAHAAYVAAANHFFGDFARSH